MGWWVWAVIAAAVLVLAAGLVLIALIPTPGKTPWNNVGYHLVRVYLRLLHRARVGHAERLPAAGGVLVVANHTAGLDPLLVTAFAGRPIRWVMAEDMRIDWLGWFWRWQRVIIVRRETQTAKADSLGLRDALAELKAGGVVGIFPEGSLERPPEQVLPFQPGVGLLIKRARCPVVPVLIEGTPQYDPAWASLWHTSRSSATFAEPIDYTAPKPDGSSWSAAEIAADLRQRYLDWSGWPKNDDLASAMRTRDGKPVKGARVRPGPPPDTDTANATIA